MSLAPAFLDELRARTSLSSLVGKTVKLTRAGREMKGCCPFHNEKTPSFYVNDDKGFAHCFGCSWHTATRSNGSPTSRACPSLTRSRSWRRVPAWRSPRSAAAPPSRRRRPRGCTMSWRKPLEWFAEQLNGLAGADARSGSGEARRVGEDRASDFGLGFAPDSRGKLKAALAILWRSRCWSRQAC